VFGRTEAQQQTVSPDLSERLQPSGQGGKVDGARVFMDLHRIPAAESDGRPTITGQCAEAPLTADFTVRPGLSGSNLRPLAGPEVVCEKRAAQAVLLPGEELEGFGYLNGGGEVDG
jgi:hypothetical protein